MGTNYYVKGERFKDLEDGGLHIGKQSAGWVFMFHSQNFEDEPREIEYSLRSFRDFVFFLLTLRAGESIVNEYGELIAPIDLLRMALASRGKISRAGKLDGTYRDHGIDFCIAELS